MKNKKGILNRKLLNYYSDINLKNYRKILFEAMDYYEGNNFSKVLDIGCGVGSFIESINFLKIKAIGLEGSDIGLNKCKERKIDCRKFFLNNKKKIPFRDNYFSFVLMNQVIEHLDRDTGTYYLDEILRVLEPGGVAIIKSPSKYSRIWNTDPHHIYCWKPYDLFKEVVKRSNKIENVKMDRQVLEPWMLSKYNDDIIDKWHKNVKYPNTKKFLRLSVTLLDKFINIFFNTDRLLSVSNVTFVKKIK